MQDKVQVEQSLVIWRFVDGKLGHDDQTRGLVNALTKHISCQCVDIAVSSADLKAILNLLTGVFPIGKNLPLPDLIIGAGHQTHLPMLAAKRAYGGKIVVLMQPSLPTGLFDLCLIPEHDEYRGPGKVIETRGVLNSARAAGQHYDNRGLIMIGGPSKHFDWDADKVFKQIEALIGHHPDVDFQLTTSRRTPADFLNRLQQLACQKVRVYSGEQTTQSWLSEQLANVSSTWVTEDSASMIYSALTAQTAVGVLSMPSKQNSRLSKGINKLIGEGAVVRFDPEANYIAKHRPAIGFLEADRCAKLILSEWLETVSVTSPQLAS